MCYTKYFLTPTENFDWIEEEMSCVGILHLYSDVDLLPVDTFFQRPFALMRYTS